MTAREEPRFLRSLSVSDTAPAGGYPYDIPAIAGLGELEFAPVTVLVGENGSGKSTLIEQGTHATVAAGMLLPPKAVVRPDDNDFVI